MNERAVDHLAVMVINCSIVAAMVWLILHDHGWWSLLLMLCFASSGRRECSPQGHTS